MLPHVASSVADKIIHCWALLRLVETKVKDTQVSLSNYHYGEGTKKLHPGLRGLARAGWPAWSQPGNSVMSGHGDWGKRMPDSSRAESLTSPFHPTFSPVQQSWGLRLLLITKVIGNLGWVLEHTPSEGAPSWWDGQTETPRHTWNDSFVGLVLSAGLWACLYT